MYIVQAYIRYKTDARDYVDYGSNEHELLSSDTIDGLYEEIAKYKIQNEYWQDDDNWGSAEFSNIFESIQDCEVDSELIVKTHVMTQHLERLAREAEVKRLRVLEAEEKAKQKKLQDEYQKYLELAKQFGPVENK